MTCLLGSHLPILEQCSKAGPAAVPCGSTLLENRMATLLRLLNQSPSQTHESAQVTIHCGWLEMKPSGAGLVGALLSVGVPLVPTVCCVRGFPPRARRWSAARYPSDAAPA
eukprot:4863200-Prymnesium_polylepis.1